MPAINRLSFTMLEETLKKFYGFDTFKTGQKRVIEQILNQQSAAAIFPTGAGKSMCYQLPALLLPGLTLVVSPLLALMKDQLEFLKKNKIPAERLDSTLTPESYKSVIKRAKNNSLKILMVSVERFKNERFRTQVSQMKLSLLVIDEAHCISEWGHNFRPEYLKLPLYQDIFNIPQVLLLTATATEKVRLDMCRKFRIPVKNIICTGFYRSNLFLQVTPVSESKKNAQLLRAVKKHPDKPIIIYVTLQKRAEEIAVYLSENGILAAHYHAGMKPEERESVQNQFMSDKINCIVATIAFGMGIDKKNIRAVIHYDLPKSLENYSQEIGRAGRDGESSVCEVLANRDNIYVLENFVYGDTPEKSTIHALLEDIKASPNMVWETRLTDLARTINIRILPLSTLLVYLEMEGLISSKYTYFEDYRFKFLLDPEEICCSFSGERKTFLQAIFSHCEKKKVWYTVHIPTILANYDTDRKRVITALDYLFEKGYIELESKQSIQVYEILDSDFDIHTQTDTLHKLFLEKEENEINRIKNMISYFENENCLSNQLAKYFGEETSFEQCQHCSVCKTGPVKIETATVLQPITAFNLEEWRTDFKSLILHHYSDINFAKYLCGIHTPIFTKLKIKQLPQFGILERYPFKQVLDWAGYQI